METSSGQTNTSKALGRTLVATLVLSIIVTIVGLCMRMAHIRHVNDIRVGCGYHANCILLYSRHHMGMASSWPTVFTVGIVGICIATLLLVVVRISERSQHLGS